jgi:cytoskeletal protein CcmA (bactofilin family)
MSKSGEEKMREYEKKLRDLTILTTSISGSGRVSVPGIGELHISGSGHVSPEEIRVSGSGHIPGGFRVGRIRSSGSFTIGGDIEADEMNFSGSASVMGNVYAKGLTASGSFKAEGGAVGESMRFSGSCRFGGDVQLEDSLTVHGSLTVSGDVTARNLAELDGSFDIAGKLTTSTFKAELSYSRSHVEKGIQADFVDVRKRSGAEGLVLFGFPIFGRRFREGELSTTDIVGREKVYLENVYCDNVTGRDVVIGEGCEVRGRIRYSGTVEVHPKARIMNAPEKEG